MTIEELKQVLREKRICEELIQMPAVVLPIYKDFADKTKDDFKKSYSVCVARGEWLIFIADAYTTKIVLKEDGTAELTKDDDEVVILNKYGIEQEYSDKAPMGIYENMNREGAHIVTRTGKRRDNTWYDTKHLDNGHWSIKSAKGNLVEKRTSFSDGENIIDINGLDGEAFLEEFDSMAKTVIQDFPNTEGWYLEKRKELEEYIAIASWEKFKELNAENKELKETIENLQGTIQKLQGMLKIALEGFSTPDKDTTRDDEYDERD